MRIAQSVFSSLVCCGTDGVWDYARHIQANHLRSQDTAKQTWHFQIHAYPPISIPLWTPDIQIAEPYLFHAFNDRASFLVPSYTCFVPVTSFARLVKGVDEVEMLVVNRSTLPLR
jgi:hypothetical protein